jgi:bifunctional enzyme CysN/CysC
VTRIVTKDGDLERAVAGQSVTLTLAHDVDVSRGDLLTSIHSPAAIADQFLVTLIWMQNDPMLPGRPYLLKIGARTVGVTVTSLKYKVNVNTLEHLAAKQLELNEIGICNIALDRQVPFDPYLEHRETGGFILIDRFTNDTVGAGLIHYSLWRADNIHWQALDVDKAARSRIKGQRPCALWFTGLSGAGKSTIANLLDQRLLAAGKHTYILDGDNVRHGLNKDLGFTNADRVENIRRVAEVMRLMVDAGLIVMVSFISPFRSERRMARNLVAEGEFIEIFVDTPLTEAEKRDTKGLYRKARRGELKHFTGIDSPYEDPEHPEIRIDTIATTPHEAVELIVRKLASSGILGDGF